MANKDIVYIEQ